MSVLVGELDSLPNTNYSGGKPQSAFDRKARLNCVYEKYNTKASVLAAIDVLEGMKADLEKKKLEKGQFDPEKANSQIEALENALKPLHAAMDSLKVLPADNPAVVNLQQQIRQIEMQKNELSTELQKFQSVGTPEQRIEAIDRTVADFRGVISYFEKTAQTISAVDGRYAGLQQEIVPLPINPEERRRTLAIQKKVARNMRGTLRSLDIIEEPGRGELNEGETIRDRAEAFLGKDISGEREALGLKPDEREEIMALWYAGLEPSTENLMKVRAFFKSPEYLRVRTKAVDSISRMYFQQQGETAVNRAARISVIQNTLAQLFSIQENTKPQLSKKEEDLDVLCARMRDNINMPPIDLNDRHTLTNTNINMKIGLLAEKFTAWEALILAAARANVERGGRNNGAPENDDLTKKHLKTIIAEVLPFLAEQMGAGTIHVNEMGNINKYVPGFVTYNVNDGLAMLENVPGTGGKDALNRMAAVRFHKSKKETALKNEQKRKNDEMQTNAMRAKEDAETLEINNAEMKIRALFEAILEELAKLSVAVGERKSIRTKMKEIVELRQSKMLLRSINALSALGVDIPENDESQPYGVYLEQLLENAAKTAGKLFTGKSKKAAIEAEKTTISAINDKISGLEEIFVEERGQIERINEEVPKIEKRLFELIVHALHEIDQRKKIIDGSQDKRKADFSFPFYNIFKDLKKSERSVKNLAAIEGIIHINVDYDLRDAGHMEKWLNQLLTEKISKCLDQWNV